MIVITKLAQKIQWRIRERRVYCTIRATSRVIAQCRLAKPATVLHAVFGTSFSAHVLSAIYLWFLPLVPLALTAWLIWSRNISYGYWFATSQCIAWALGTASYYALPTLGPGLEYSWLYRDLSRAQGDGG